ncbi:MAG: DUF2975 domain-containing protein [Alphaproteobacteria bacterium]|nr:MAG: DUF2975 domain-containing protein [Alphaproteobacteria bacterium]
MSGQRKLTKIASTILGIAWVLGIIAAVTFPIMVVVMTSGMLDQADDVTVGFFAGFKFFAEAATDTPLLHGHSQIELAMEDTGGAAWVLLIAEIGALIFLYGLWHLRKVFAMLRAGNPFSFEMVRHIKMVGIVILVWQVARPLFEYVTGSILLANADLGIAGLEVYPAFELSVGGIFVGLAVIVLSGVLAEAADLHEDQSLTV